MAHDYQLVGGVLVLLFGLVAVANAMVEGRSPLAGLVGVFAGAGLLAWAWVLADGQISLQSLPEAVYRLIARWR